MFPDNPTIIADLFLILSSGVLAFVIALALTPWFTNQLIKFKIGKQIRENAISGEKASLFAELHAKKSGTPTMGGLLIWGTVILVVVISIIMQKLGYFKHSLFNRNETWIPLFTLVTCGLLGAVDDYLNVKGIGKTKGLSAKLKLLWLTIFSAVGAWWFTAKLGFDSISIPIPGIESIYVGPIGYFLIFIFIIIATANAVNFTDGLDGLASGLLIMAFGAFGIIAFTKGLLVLATLCAVIAGAQTAFLWFNVPPAKFYMGDTGSMALGATLGVIAMLTQQTLILPIIGFIFVIEALSVIIQLTSKKFFKRKVFKIAPIHHHFEKIGWAEFTVVMRFWIVGGIMTALGTVLGLINVYF
ncbi:phospho-N-acetylmuramoyl-pentapeptide-transferase [Candidatus Peregrinibacteria bacterium]|nr:phospho-N-acetylmuramoyl-pentapeptide-transferase [Candidatus Peregrinibacteria bacterium]MBT7736829.1 phospho-N-acetylmuramoyl-pentapeptide-transferase [Candidatus Peregrinibacteria bacterium]